MSELPRDRAFDSSLAFLREGYTFISSRCDRLQTDMFQTRLMLRPVVCMRGREAAGMFYGGGRFTRVGAIPMSVVLLLQDLGSVQTLEGEAHLGRKLMFMSVMEPDALRRLVELYRAEWNGAVPRWQGRRVVLHDELIEILTRTVAAWAGVPMAEQDAHERAKEIGSMIEKTGTIGPPNWWARYRRNRTERWAAGIIREIRKGERAVPEGSAAAIIAAHRDSDGQPLSDDVAAIELLNVLRPTVAVGRFIVFAAHALHRHPQWRDRFAAGDESDLEGFVQEVRRLYPFFPAVGGKARAPFEWRGHQFDKGDWVIVDLYGTDHDPREWQDPEAFRPERFRTWNHDPNNLVPQGAGNYRDDHRCPGEWITIALMKEAVKLLSQGTQYDVPAQDLTVRLNRIPALPESGFIIENAQLVDGSGTGAGCPEFAVAH
ncbi:MAG TPA: cytochrome P450 [Geminicoccus sp.]|jgi:fatty-acid peroxygenase|uniref:cytochrome P450 n=1 Tax=Geminicoccus sp. TaxID=2024832 RepID=UPI002E320C25|nr:cytochrome P450 [Geminicoccus sp.]HEX2527986.1 cytochrome P450 [Geminicoccus sp.]